MARNKRKRQQAKKRAKQLAAREDHPERGLVQNEDVSQPQHEQESAERRRLESLEKAAADEAARLGSVKERQAAQEAARRQIAEERATKKAAKKAERIEKAKHRAALEAERRKRAHQEEAASLWPASTNERQGQLLRQLCRRDILQISESRNDLAAALVDAAAS